MSSKNKSRLHKRRQKIGYLLFVAFLCTLLFELLGGSNPLVSAASAASDEAIEAADELYELGLFQGSGTNADGSPNYNLDQPLNRAEAITMMVRILGKEEEAKAGTWETPFQDVPSWAEPYVGFAYVNQYTSGTGKTTFGSADRINAAQYITTILRALDYSSSTDFQWDHPWELSDKIGLTDGQYTDANNNDFLRADAVIISAAALDIKLKDSDAVLREWLYAEPKVPAETASSFSIDYSGDIPVETGKRKLTDAQLATLAGKTPEDAAASIATLADAYAWLSQEGYSTTGMSISPSSKEIANGTYRKDASWVEVSTVINTLLVNDYDEVGTILCIAQPDEPGWDIYYISFNYVKTGGKYYITDPLDQLPSTGWPVYRIHTVITDKLDTVKDALAETNDSITNLVTLATYRLTKDPLVPEYVKSPMAVTFPQIEGIQYLYRANAEAATEYEKEQAEIAKAEAERWAKIAPSRKISKYGLPDVLGKTTLTYQDATALVGQDPAEIAEQVKTVGDALQYMIAARFGYNAPSAYTPWYEGWGFDAPGDVQLQQNYGCCCGGYANTVCYLLAGDYEKIGELRWVGGGNHVINWIYTGGKYYVVDFTQYCVGGNYDNYFAPVTILDRLEDFYDEMPDIYSFFPKSEVVIMVAYETGAEGGYPSQWFDPPQFTGLTLPKEAEGKVTIIYQKDKQYGVEYKEITSTIPGWND